MSKVVSVRCEDNHQQKPCNVLENPNGCGVAKCCAADKVFDKRNRICAIPREKSSVLSRVKLFSSEFPHEKSSRNSALLPNQMESIADFCQGRLIALYLDEFADIRMLENGGLYYKGLGVWSSQFCVDHFVKDQQGKLLLNCKNNICMRSN